MKHTPRQKAARKAAKTRLANRYMLKRWREVEEPAIRRIDAAVNYLLKRNGPISVRWNPTNEGGKSHRLKHGVEYGTLIQFVNGGRLIKVLAEGYKHPKIWHPAFWEPLL